MKIRMKKLKGPIWTLLLGICLLILIPVFAKDELKNESGFAEEEKLMGSGSLSDTVNWTVTEDDLGNRTLWIGGIGPMPDFKNSSEQPWKEWNDRIFRLVVADEVTRIGNNTMGGMLFKEVEIGTGVESIGKHAFAYGRNLEHLRIPGNVKRIESNAFVYHYTLSSVTFEEGVEEIEHSSFGGQSGKGSVFHIPASMKKIADLACWIVTGYTVDEENPYYCAVDGVLYDKEMTAIVDYPKYRIEEEYRIPDSVCEIKLNAFHRVAYLKKLHIPSTVQKMQANELLRWSNVEEVYIDDGVPIGGVTTFYGCGKLRKARLPENIDIKMLSNTFAGSCNSLESMKIPNGVQKIETLGWPTKALESIVYDGEDTVLVDRQMVDNSIRYDLTIGEHVDVLPKEFHWFSTQARDIRFQGPNQLEVAEGAIESEDSLFDRIQGSLYVDEQGVVYQYSSETGEAKLMYCQPGFTDIFIPAAISPEEGVVCLIRSIGQEAFRKAEGLRTLNFEKPEQIRLIEPYGFAYCNSLIQVNGIETVEGVEGLFSGLNEKPGYGAFYQTGLKTEDGSVDSKEGMDSYGKLQVSAGKVSSMNVEVVSAGGTLEWTEEAEGQGKYSLLTGDVLTVSANVGNRDGDENYRYRVYFQKSQDDCNLSVQEGEIYLLNEQEIVCMGTEDPNTVYVEFIPKIGKTISIPVTAVYPSPHSAGGSLKIWALILTEEEAQEKEGTLVFSKDGAIQTEWKTLREEFSLTKTGTGKEKILLRGTEGGVIRPADNLVWKIVLQRVPEEVSNYGKDYVRKVIYCDQITLPKGVSWNPQVKASIKEGKIRRDGNHWYAGSIRICTLALSGSQLNLAAVRFQWLEEKETFALSYEVKNNVTDAQISTNTITYTVYPEAIEVDSNQITAGTEQKAVNRIEAVVEYDYFGKKSLSGEADKILTANSGSVEFQKTSVKEVNYFGESLEYNLKLNNPGAFAYQADSEGFWTIRDTLSPYSYLTVGDMKRMFAEDQQKGLTILIKNVEEKEWEEQIGAYEDSVYWKNGYNSGENRQEYGNQQIRISWTEDGKWFRVEKDGLVSEGENLEEMLRQMKYAPGRWAEYILEWKLGSEEEKFTLRPGEEICYSVYATVKDSFSMLSRDWPNTYPSEGVLTIVNSAQLIRQNGTQHKAASVRNQVKREAYIDKYLYANKTILKDGFSVEDGTELSYTLKFTHYGKGVYENLPMKDEMYGAQALLVPVDWNPHLANRELEIYQNSEGNKYYILTEGDYFNVKVGGENECVLIAGKIQVENISEPVTVKEEYLPAGEEEPVEKSYSYKGLKTSIEWGFPNLPARTYSLYVNYKALVIQKLADENVYTIGNKVWMNDKTDSRIFASLWGGGTVIGFDKEILERKGESWKTDAVNSEDYSLIHAGEQVTYRLTLRSSGNGQYVVKGNDIFDELPFHGNVKPWIAGDNVSISYESTHSSTKIEKLDRWRIEDSRNGEYEEGQQYILWSDETMISFQENDARVYIYVTLNYPGSQENLADWKNYCQAVNGDLLVNTFYVYMFPSNVTHHLDEPGEVLLKKGVYSTSYGTVNNLIKTQSRLYYNNRDSKDRQVIYYILLYNGGAKNWYLDEICDVLPKGVTFKGLVADGNLRTSGDGTMIQTGTSFDGNELVQASLSGIESEEVVWRNAVIKGEVDESGRLNFHIEEGKEKESIRFDEEKGRCYLKQHEAIVFGYICDIGKSTDTEDRIVNAAFMEYVDVPLTGVALTEEGQIDFRAPRTPIHIDQNDGNSVLTTGRTIKERFDVGEGKKETTWLYSQVSLERGEIIPGLTKYVDSYKAAGSGEQLEYVNHVGPQDRIQWKVRLHNNGTLAISDYTVRDCLPQPYLFEGDIIYKIYDYAGNLMKENLLLTFKERKNNNISIYNYNSIKTVIPNGDPVKIQTSQYGSGSLWIEQKADGSEILNIHFADSSVSIPEGGYMDLQLSSYNPTTIYKNTVYVNQAELILHGTDFVRVGQGSVLKDENQKPYGVKNSAPVTVSFGYGTGSEKTIEEKGKEEKKASSVGEGPNYIVLSSEDSVFTYRLMVSNDTEKPMEKLVFIDSLPETGDVNPFHEESFRNSEFSVSFAKNPNVSVTVVMADGTSLKLNNEEFRTEYSNLTEFSEEDWNGSSSWKEQSQGAKTLRLVIEDKSGTRIPPDAKVEVSFDCVIEGQALPGQIGWNSFGYHYKLKDIEQELEAMPLPVGVKIPEVPTLQKKLEDEEGNPVLSKENRSYQFLLFDKEPNRAQLSGSEKIEKWIDILEKEGISYRKVEVKVSEGQSCSDVIQLKDMTWRKGQTYYLKEFVTEEGCSFSHFNGIKQDIYSFVYEEDKEEAIVCVNRIGRKIAFPLAGGMGDWVYQVPGIHLTVAAFIMHQLNKERKKKYETDEKNS